MRPVFTNALPTLIDEAEPGSIEKSILTLLSGQARGRKNAMPWREISAFITDFLGFKGKSKNWFQNGMVNKSRKGDLFIGSCRKGFFLIETLEDAQEAEKTYVERIAQEQAHLDQLRRLKHDAWGL